jgi:hypothetical protein
VILGRAGAVWATAAAVKARRKAVAMILECIVTLEKLVPIYDKAIQWYAQATGVPAAVQFQHA